MNQYYLDKTRKIEFQHVTACDLRNQIVSYLIADIIESKQIYLIQLL